jgi:FkbM family methyltransferase
MQQLQPHLDASDGPVFWFEGSVFWFEDGVNRMAVAVPERGQRFFRHGIRHRLVGLTYRYLQGRVSISPDDCVINIGANIGEVAVCLEWRGAKVLAIEPDSHVLPALKANADGRNIWVEPVAAWKQDGELEMYLATASGDTSVFQPAQKRIEGRMTFPARRIDTLAREYEIDHVRLIVGDAEGAEPEVLEGAAETLKITDYVSLCASAERDGERTMEACEIILHAAGFDIIHRGDQGFCTLIAKSRNS